MKMRSAVHQEFGKPLAVQEIDIEGPEAIEAARMGWGLCTLLGVAGKGMKLEVVPRLSITGRKVQGGSFGGARGRTHVPQLVDMYVRGELDLDPFVSHLLTLDDVNKGFDLMHEQDGIRSVLVFD